MSSRLFERYFPIDEDVEDEHEREAAVDNRERLVSLVASPGWTLFRDRMDEIIESAMDVQAGTEQQMLHQIGYKDGLLQVRKLLRCIEREIVAGRD